MEMIKVFNDHTGEILEKTFVDPLVRGATFTTHKTIVFKRGE